MSIEKLFDLDPSDRDDYFMEYWDWSSDELKIILDKINYGDNSDNNILVHSIATHPQTNIDNLKVFSLSGKYGAGCIKSVLMNDNCTEEIIRGIYNKSPEDKIYLYEKNTNIEKWGKDFWNQSKSGIVESINKLALEHKNCPKDLQE